MFHTLSQQMKRDQEISRSFVERSLELAGALTVAIALFAIFYFVFLFMQ
jgi:hypothetical protein